MAPLPVGTLFCISLLFLQLQGPLSAESWLQIGLREPLAGIASSDQLEQHLMPQTWIPKWHQALQPQESYSLDRTLDQPLKNRHCWHPHPLQPSPCRLWGWLQNNACERPSCQTDKVAHRPWNIRQPGNHMIPKDYSSPHSLH